MLLLLSCMRLSPPLASLAPLSAAVSAAASSVCAHVACCWRLGPSMGTARMAADSAGAGAWLDVTTVTCQPRGFAGLDRSSQP